MKGVRAKEMYLSMMTQKQRVQDKPSIENSAHTHTQNANFEYLTKWMNE